MKQIALLMLLAAAVFAAAEKRPAPKPAKPRPATAAPTVTIPKDAVQVDANTYTYNDAEGKKWIYRRTPFGISKAQERPPSAEEAAQAAKVIAATSAVERGDQIEFSRPGTFGVYRWQRRKSDLNDMEKAVWDRELRKAGRIAAKPE
jgi:hypothetical protein